MAVWLGGVKGDVRRPLATTDQPALAEGVVEGAVDGGMVGLRLIVGSKELKSHCKSMEGLIVESLRKSGPTLSLGGQQKSIPTLVDVLLGPMASRISSSGRVNVTRLLVLAGWEEQKPPVTHLPLIAALSWASCLESVEVRRLGCRSSGSWRRELQGGPQCWQSSWRWRRRESCWWRLDCRGQSSRWRRQGRGRPCHWRTAPRRLAREHRPRRHCLKETCGGIRWRLRRNRRHRSGRGGTLLTLDGLLRCAGPGIPIGTLLREAAGGEQGEGGHRGKPVLRDGQISVEGFLLGLLESVDVLGDSGVILPPALHVDGQRDDVSGFEPGHVGGEMVQHVAERGLIIVGRGAPQRKKPCFLDDAEEEETAVAFDGADETLELLLGGPIVFGTSSNGVGGVDGDGWIVHDEGDDHGVEDGAMDQGVVSVRVDETGEAAGAARNVDRLEQIREGLAERFHVVVGQLANDGGVGASKVAEEGFRFLRCRHGAGDGRGGRPGVCKRASCKQRDVMGNREVALRAHAPRSLARLRVRRSRDCLVSHP
eukprot:scaffold288_cov44-Cyclotella_meneghiniana.AAC.3